MFFLLPCFFFFFGVRSIFLYAFSISQRSRIPLSNASSNHPVSPKQNSSSSSSNQSQSSSYDKAQHSPSTIRFASLHLLQWSVGAQVSWQPDIFQTYKPHTTNACLNVPQSIDVISVTQKREIPLRHTKSNIFRRQIQNTSVRSTKALEAQLRLPRNTKSGVGTNLKF